MIEIKCNTKLNRASCSQVLGWLKLSNTSMIFFMYMTLTIVNISNLDMKMKLLAKQRKEKLDEINN